MATLEQTTITSNLLLSKSGVQARRSGQRYTFAGVTLTHLSFPLKKLASPVGNVTYEIRLWSDKSLITSDVLGAASSITTDYVWYEKELTTPQTLTGEYWVGVHYYDGYTDRGIYVGYANSDVIAGSIGWESTSGIWSTAWGTPPDDCAFIVTYVTGSDAPTIVTNPVTQIDVNTATGNWNITALGSINPTAHGVCWNTDGTPTTDDDKTDEGAASAIGAGTSSLTGLSGGVKYYVRAYAINFFGTSYGTEVSFTSGENASLDSIDISADVQYARYTRGKDEELEQALAGRVELRMKNTTEKYTPFNTESDLYGSLLPGKRVAYNYEGQTLFTGSMEKLVPHPRMTQQDAYLLALDGLDFLSRAKISTILYPDYKSGQIINLILDAAGWPSQERVIDDGYTVYPYTVWFLETALKAIGDVTIYEQGLSYVDHRGYFIFEDRNHRLRETRSKVSQYSFDDDDINDITFDYGSARIYNHVEGERINWLVPGVSAEMARLKTENPMIPPEESRTFYLPFSVITDTVSDVTKGTDVDATTAAAGAGNNKNTDLTVTTTAYAKGVKVVFVNAAIVPVYLSVPGETADGFKVRGEPFTENEAVKVIEENAASQTAYQIRTYKVPGSFYASVEDLRQICKKIVHYYKDPQALITITLKNKDATLLAKMLALLISDRITITSTKLSLTTEDFYINKIEHTIERAGNVHTMELTLVRAYDEEFVILGVSALGINTRLG